MKEKQILDEFIDKIPFELEGESKRLFMAIMKVADENDELRSGILGLNELKPDFSNCFAKIENDKIIMDLDFYDEIKTFLDNVYDLIEDVEKN